MNTLLKVVIFLVVSLLFIKVANACSCKKHKEFTLKEYNDLGLIFTGEVIEKYKDTLKNENIIKFKVSKIIKGKDVDGFVYAVNPISQCMLHVNLGEYYLLFLKSESEKPFVSMCSRKIKIENIDNYKIPHWLTSCTYKKEGLNKLYHLNQKLSSEGHYYNGKLEGFWKFYNKDGELSETGYYKRGLKDSIWTSFNYNGKRKDIITYKNDTLHGESISYYYNGAIEYEEHYKNGLRNGLSYGFSENGTKNWENNYKNGVSIESTSYFENGNKMQYHSDSLITRWYQNENKEDERVFKDGKIYSRNCWFENGKLNLALIFDSEENHIIVYAAKENGDIMVKNGTGYYKMYGEEGSLKDSLKVGKWKQEFSDGAIKETIYKKGEKSGVFKQFNKKGHLLVKGNYKNNKEKGIWKYWYSDNQIRFEKKWMKGQEYLINSWTSEGVAMVIKGNGLHTYYDVDGIKNDWVPTKEYINGK